VAAASRFDQFMPPILRLAAVHCTVWGCFVIVSPGRSAAVYGLGQRLTDEWLWQGTGLVIFLLGLGYGIAASDPRRHYVVVLIGLLAKVLGPIGLCWSVYQGAIPPRTLLLLPINDILWWAPFGWIVYEGLLSSCRTVPRLPEPT
jgi:small multidrug resistance pump